MAEELETETGENNKGTRVSKQLEACELNNMQVQPVRHCNKRGSGVALQSQQRGT